MDTENYTPKSISSTITFDPPNYSYIETVAKDTGMSKSAIVNELLSYARRVLNPHSEHVLIQCSYGSEEGFLVLRKAVAEGILQGVLDPEDYFENGYFVSAEDVALAENSYTQYLSSLPIIYI